MKSADIHYALHHLLPKGWQLEQLADDPGSGDLIAIVREGRARARRLKIPAAALAAWSTERAVAIVQDAIDEGLGLGRYATTPIVQADKPWSPYP